MVNTSPGHAKSQFPIPARFLTIGICYLAAFFLFAVTFDAGTARADLVMDHDLATGINSNVQQFISYRYMRKMWISSDGVIAAVVQQGKYQGQGLGLYESLDRGNNWQLDAPISTDPGIVSDGIMDSNNNLLLVTSLLSENRTVNVEFIRMLYNPASKSWSLDPSTPVTIFPSSSTYTATVATIAQDSNGVLWCAFRLHDIANDLYEIKVYYSADGGMNWQDSGNTFAGNSSDEKCAKVISVNSRIMMVYHADLYNGTAWNDYKLWAARSDTQPLQSPWTAGGYIAKMMNQSTADPYGSHWSVAADSLGNVYMTYQDNGIKYVKFNAATNQWTSPMTAATWGEYSETAVDSTNDVFIISKNQTETGLIVRWYSAAKKKWSGWYNITSQVYRGLLRMSSPARFSGQLPVFFEVNPSPPFAMMYDLLDGTVTTGSQYDISAYGGAWACQHHDNRNSNYAPVSIASTYTSDWLDLQPGQQQRQHVAIGPRDQTNTEYIYYTLLGTLNGQPNTPMVLGKNGDTGENLVTLTPPDVDNYVFWATPLIASNGDFIVGGNSGIMRYSPQGVPRWSQPTPVAGETPASPQFLSDGNLLLMTWNGWIYVVNSQNGTILWQANMTPNRVYPNPYPLFCEENSSTGECSFSSAPAVDPFTNSIYETFNDSNGNVKLQKWTYDPSTHALTLVARSSSLPGGMACSPALSPDYQKVYTCDGVGDAVAYNVNNLQTPAWSINLGFPPKGAFLVNPDGYLVPNIGPGEPITVLKDLGKSAAIVYQDNTYIPVSAPAGGKNDRFVLVGCQNDGGTKGASGLVVFDTNGIVSFTPWGSTCPETGSVTLGDDGSVYFEGQGPIGLKKFTPVSQ